jgi:hypothetical protein
MPSPLTDVSWHLTGPKLTLGLDPNKCTKRRPEPPLRDSTQCISRHRLVHRRGTGFELAACHHQPYFRAANSSGWKRAVPHRIAKHHVRNGNASVLSPNLSPRSVNDLSETLPEKYRIRASPTVHISASNITTRCRLCRFASVRDLNGAADPTCSPPDYGPSACGHVAISTLSG